MERKIANPLWYFMWNGVDLLRTRYGFHSIPYLWGHMSYKFDQIATLLLLHPGASKPDLYGRSRPLTHPKWWLHVSLREVSQTSQGTLRKPEGFMTNIICMYCNSVRYAHPTRYLPWWLIYIPIHKINKSSINIPRSSIFQKSSISIVHDHDRRIIIAKYIGKLDLSLYTASPT